jgi:hypothetical protein
MVAPSASVTTTSRAADRNCTQPASNRATRCGPSRQDTIMSTPRLTPATAALATALLGSGTPHAGAHSTPTISPGDGAGHERRRLGPNVHSGLHIHQPPHRYDIPPSPDSPHPRRLTRNAPQGNGEHHHDQTPIEHAPRPTHCLQPDERDHGTDYLDRIISGVARDSPTNSAEPLRFDQTGLRGKIACVLVAEPAAKSIGPLTFPPEP